MNISEEIEYIKQNRNCRFVDLHMLNFKVNGISVKELAKGMEVSESTIIRMRKKALKNLTEEARLLNLLIQLATKK